MGNCCRSGKSTGVVWAGDDWGSVASKYKQVEEGDDDGNGEAINHHVRISSEKERLLGGSGGDSPVTKTEVKIKMSKKELDELVRQVNLQGLSLEQVLTRMVNEMNRAGGLEEEQHRPWRPVLQSIPESESDD